MKRRNYNLLVLIVLVSIGIFSLAGCGGGNTVSQPDEPITEPIIVDPIEDRLTVADIKASIADSIYLDATHINQGMDCNICHSELSEDKTPPAPTRETCLNCHSGTYEELAKTTDYLGVLNPHNSHEGQLDCSWCHQVHKPFYNYCSVCHSYDVDIRFK